MSLWVADQTLAPERAVDHRRAGFRSWNRGIESLVSDTFELERPWGARASPTGHAHPQRLTERPIHCYPGVHRYDAAGSSRRESAATNVKAPANLNQSPFKRIH